MNMVSMNSLDVSAQYDNSRSLAGAGEGSMKLDFTVFAMAVMTMSLLLAVEVIRHGIDKWARGNDFFEAVLRTVYSELSTLGLVEAIIFLAHHYYPDLDIQKERVFADVHFTLFFVAIINALISCIIYIISSHVATNRWVQLETLDANHYLAFRKQFDQVEQELKKIANPKQLKHVSSFHSSTTLNNSNIQTQPDKETFTDNHDVEDSKTSTTNTTTTRNANFISFVGSVLQKPANKLSFGQHRLLTGILEEKYHELLVQLRFHEIRVHFIESHGLKSNFKISKYLILGMNDVFMDFVHLSTRTWLVLLGCINVLYYSMAVLTFFTKNDIIVNKNQYDMTYRAAASQATTSNSGENEEKVLEAVPIALTYLYIGYCVVFIFISFIISIKMQRIFDVIVKKSTWVNRDNNEERKLNKPKNVITDYNKGKALKQLDQMKLFWFAKPDLIITFAQIMQFGYSVGFAILIVYSKLVNDKVLSWWWYFLCLTLSFILFVAMWSVIIPQYTQCTSVGDLLNSKHLVELDAFSKLEEEKNRRQEQLDRIMIEKEVNDNMTKRTKETIHSSRARNFRRQQTSIDESLEMISDLVKTTDVQKKRVYFDANTITSNGKQNNDKSTPTVKQKTNIEKKPVGMEVVTKFSSRMRSNSELTGSESTRMTTSSSGNGSTSKDQSIIETEMVPLEIKLRNALLTKTYRQCSGAFGTLLLMYFLSLRLQILLIKTCRIVDLNNVWYFWLTFSDIFWIVILFFSAFILESSIVIIIFLREKEKKNFYMVLAGATDIVLTCICIAIFLGAEFIRCSRCQSVNESTDVHENIHNMFARQLDTTSCQYMDIYTKNPTFGSCLCGGLGVLELFTFMISLRMVRFYIAYYFTSSSKDDKVKVQDINESLMHRYHDKAYSTIKGTIAQLWVLALRKNKDIVKKHGIFSGNMLESMLGIDPLPDGYEKHEGSEIDKKTSIFDRPYAKIVRCMRRCYCKWHPFLSDEWVIVDVVLTEYELVWFDAKVDTERLSAKEIDVLESVKQKLSNASKETVVLNDAAYCRTVLGRVSLATLERIKVDRRLPQITTTTNISSANNIINDRTSKMDNDVENMNQLRLRRSEYWSSPLQLPSALSSLSSSSSSTTTTNATKYSFNRSSISIWTNDDKEWFDNYTIQDKLKLVTNHGSLLLWFVEDINEAIKSEGHTNIANSSIMKDYESEAFSWCKEIVDLVGTGNCNKTKNQSVIQNLVEVEGQKLDIVDGEEGSVKKLFSHYRYFKS